MRLSKRDLLTGIGGVALGTIGLSTLSTESKANSITVQNLDVANSTNKVSSPVQSAQLAVQGEYSVSAEVVPSRVILRLEAKRATNQDYQQLTAEEPGQSLSKEFTEPFDFTQNLLSIDGINAPLLTPDAVGDTVSIDVDVRLRLIVKNDGKTLKEMSVEDTATLKTEKTLSEVKVGVESTGDMNVSD